MEVALTGHTASDRVAELLHELAEATQALGNYLSALRRDAASNARVPPSREIADRALSQYARSLHAIRELRAEWAVEGVEDDGQGETSP